MFYVYILYSERDHGLYIGYTKDLRTRFNQHQSGHSKSTKHRTPFKLIHYEAFITSADALAREKYLKSGHGREQIQAMLKRTLAQIELK